MLNKKVSLVAVLLGLTVGELFAGTLSSYSVGDVLLCFRKNGGANDLVVDLGPVSALTNAAPNTRIPVTQYTGAQLATIGTNNLIWSAFTWFDATVTPTSLDWTLFASNPRPSLNTQSSPVLEYKASAQQLAANAMAAVPKGAYDCYVASLYNALSTATAVIEPDNNAATNYADTAQTGQSYSYAIGQSGQGDNFEGDYQGYPENTTPANFTTAGTVQRSDFYMLSPTLHSAQYAGTYLGYFELNTNGVMTYVAYPSVTPATPVIHAITRTNNVTSVVFTTGSSGTYTLRGTNALSGPLANWPAITSAPGTGSTVMLQDTTSVANKFYVISAQ